MNSLAGFSGSGVSFLSEHPVRKRESNTEINKRDFEFIGSRFSDVECRNVPGNLVIRKHNKNNEKKEVPVSFLFPGCDLFVLIARKLYVFVQ